TPGSFYTGGAPFELRTIPSLHSGTSPWAARTPTGGSTQSGTHRRICLTAKKDEPGIERRHYPPPPSSRTATNLPRCRLGMAVDDHQAHCRRSTRKGKEASHGDE